MSELVHAAGRYAPLCWPKPSCKIGRNTVVISEVTCLDCRRVIELFTDGYDGLGVQQMFSPPASAVKK